MTAPTSVRQKKKKEKKSLSFHITTLRLHPSIHIQQLIQACAIRRGSGLEGGHGEEGGTGRLIVNAAPARLVAQE